MKTNEDLKGALLGLNEEQLRDCLYNIVFTMYGTWVGRSQEIDPLKEWDSETIELVAAELDQFGLVPEVD